MADHAGAPPARLQAHLGKLRALARSRLAGDYHYLVRNQRSKDVLLPARDRQIVGVRERAR